MSFPIQISDPDSKFAMEEKSYLSLLSTVRIVYLRYTFRLITSVPRSNSLFPSSSPGGKSQVGGENKGGGGPVVLQGQYSLSRMGLHLLEAGEVPFGRVVLRQGDQTDPEQ